MPFIPYPIIGIGMGGGGPPLSGDFPVNAVNFDGTNDWLSASSLTGAANGPLLLFSLWFNILGGDDVAQAFVIVENGTTPIVISRNSSNKLNVVFRQITNETLWNITSSDDFSTTVNAGWNHLLIAAELDATPVAQIYVNDAALSVTEVTAPQEGDIGWVNDLYAVGATNSGSVKFNGDMSEFYLTDEYLDISVVANRRKFISASGFPVDLGSDGSDPTGTAALEFFSGDTDAWHTNKGSGGGFTENGALTDAATSPSD